MEKDCVDWYLLSVQAPKVRFVISEYILCLGVLCLFPFPYRTTLKTSASAIAKLLYILATAIRAKT